VGAEGQPPTAATRGRATPYAVEPLPGLPWRRRVLIIVLALVTAFTVVSMLLATPGGAKRAASPAARLVADTAACPSPTASGAVAEACVGAVTRVLPTQQP
jgi:hypothetical protein